MECPILCPIILPQVESKSGMSYFMPYYIATKRAKVDSAKKERDSHTEFCVTQSYQIIKLLALGFLGASEKVIFDSIDF